MAHFVYIMASRPCGAIYVGRTSNLHARVEAHRAGLSAGDVLVAIDGLRVTASNLDSLLQRYRRGDAVTLHAFRRDELMSFRVVLQPESAPQWRLQSRDKPVAGVKLRRAWLRVRG